MSECDLQLYAAYAAEHMLPTRRAEIYAAQTAYIVAQTMGGYKGAFEDFLLHKADEPSGQDFFDDFDPV